MPGITVVCITAAGTVTVGGAGMALMMG